ncbi:MAG: histidine kinase [Treponema sp.]|nr:histidine kinase [Treponema sp.]
MLSENPALFGGIDTYIRLIYLFTILITALMLLLCYLYFSIKKARKHEQLSHEFSNLVIEGLETERRRVSRELHDTILPQLHGSAVSDQIRSICVDLMPPDFSCLSLKDALTLLCVKFSERTGIQFSVSMEGNLPSAKPPDFSKINAENQLHIYRMVQESLNNIEKHSGAKKAFLTVRDTSGNIIICVSDDGVGLGDKKGEGLGMRSIRQRAGIIGADVNFISEAENGLLIKIEIPHPSNNF